MELNYFRDKLFDLLNDSDEMEIADIDADERHGLLIVKTEDGDIFEIVCRRAAGQGVEYPAHNTDKQNREQCENHIAP